MNIIRARLHVAADGTISGHAPTELPAGEHEADIIVSTVPAAAPAVPEMLARIRALQAEVARLPVLDPRSLDEMLGYNADGLFD